MKRRIGFVAAYSVCLLVATSPSAAVSASRCAAPVPSGYDWPADPADLYKISGGISSKNLTISGSIDVSKQRRHGWLLFAGVTHQAGSEPNSPPAFHTWYTVEEAFDPSPGKIDCSSRHLVLKLTLPTQLVMVAPNTARDLLKKDGLDPKPRFDPDPAQFGLSSLAVQAHEGVVAFSHVAFNQQMYDWIRDNQYYKKATLDSLIDPEVARKAVVDPPMTGVSLKFSWWPVAPDKLTPVPVWDGDPRFPGDAKNPPTSWKRVVMIDPIGGQTSPQKITLGGFDHLNPQVVPLSRFYSVKISAEEAAAANSDFRIRQAATDVLGRSLQEGDYIAMTALHIATREFDPWVFTTFWWNDDPQSNARGNDMPNEVQGVFRNYIMDTSYNINAPKTSGGSSPMAFNPWLELFQLGGTRSQCMACHARSAYGPKVAASFNPIDMSTMDPNGFDASPQSADDPNFATGTLDLHRVWTIFTRAK